MRKVMIALVLVIAFSACEKDNTKPNRSGDYQTTDNVDYKRYFAHWLIKLDHEGESNYYKITNEESLRIDSLYTPGDYVEIVSEGIPFDGIWAMRMQPFIRTGDSRDGIYYRPSFD